MMDTNFNHLLKRYIVGFASALLLSVGSYLVVTSDIAGSAQVTMAIVLALAFIQLIIQLVCFLHLSAKGRSAGRSVTLAFTMLMMFIIVIGSIWIMQNLDYRMGMSGESMNEYMKEQNKKGF